jgi:hypothetical protein
MTETEKVIVEGFQIAAEDLKSHKAAIARLVENQAAQQEKLVEFAEILNEHSKLLEDIQRVWTKNFAEQGALLNAQTHLVEGLRALVLPQDPVN